MTAKRLAVLVMGVHRSGTSALTSVLADLGLELGFTPTERSKENEEGFFEYPAFRNLNDDLLAAHGASWDVWSLLADDIAADPDRIPAALRDRARSLIAGIPGTGPFVLKDPRAMVTWPFWASLLAEARVDLRLVLIARDPAEVALSQVSRSSDAPQFYAGLTTPSPMHALWTLAMQRLLANLPPEGATFLLHRDLMAEPARVAEGLARQLRLPKAGLADRIAAAAARIRPALHRARAASGDAPAATGWEAASSRLFAALSALPSPVALTAADGARLAALLPEVPVLLPFLGAMRETHGSLRAELTRVAADLRKAERALAIHPAADPGLAGIRKSLDSFAGGQLGEVVRMTILRAQVAENMGDLAECERLLRRAVDFVPTNAESWKRLIDLLSRQGRKADAEAARAAARTRCPGNPAFD